MSSSKITMTKGTAPTNPASTDQTIWLDSSDNLFKARDSSGADVIMGGINADWNSTSGLSEILNKPTIPDISTLEDDVVRIEKQNTETHGSGLVSGGQIVPTTGIGFSVYPYVAYISDGATYNVRITSVAPVTGLETEYDGTNVIYLNVDNEVVMMDAPTTDPGYVLLGVIYSALMNTIIIEVVSTPIYVSGLAERLGNFSLYATGPLIVTGCTLAEGITDCTLDAALGTINICADVKTFDQTSTFTKYYLTADYGWVPDTTNANYVTPAYYNDPSQNYGYALVAVTAEYWTKSLVFRTPSGLMYFVYGQAEYATEDLAKAAPIPSVPDYLGSVAVYLGLIISQAEDTSIGLRIQDVRPYLPRIFGYGSTSAGVSLAHSSLTGLLDDDHTQYYNETRGDARYALIGNGVTNGDTHNHNGGDGAQISHTTLSDIGTNTHAQIDTFITNSPEFETSTGNILMNGSVSVGTTTTTVKANHIHPTDTSRLAATRGNWKVFYSNGSGVFTELSLGALGTVLTSAGASSAPTFSAPSAPTYGNWKLLYSNGSGAVTEVALGSAGQILKCNGTAAAPTVANIGVRGLPVIMPDLGSAMQSLSASTLTLLTGTRLQLPTGCLFVGARISWEIVIIKTAAGTATWSVDVRFGTNGTTSDAAIATWTSGTNTAAIDQARLRITCQILTLGASATARCNAFYVNTLTSVTGLGRISGATGSTATFNSTATNPYIHVCMTSGASAVFTVMAETDVIAMG